MNLVPYPRQHFILSSMSPLAAPRDVGKLVGAPRAMDQASVLLLPGGMTWPFFFVPIWYQSVTNCLKLQLADVIAYG